MKEFAELLPSTLPPTIDQTTTATIAQLHQQIAELELEVKTLKEALRLVRGR